MDNNNNTLFNLEDGEELANVDDADKLVDGIEDVGLDVHHYDLENLVVLIVSFVVHMIFYLTKLKRWPARCNIL